LTHPTISFTWNTKVEYDDDVDNKVLTQRREGGLP